jgi:hypothetical protein
MHVQLPMDILIHIFRYQIDWFFFRKQNKIVHVELVNNVLKHKANQKIVNEQLVILLPIKGTENGYMFLSQFYSSFHYNQKYNFFVLHCAYAYVVRICFDHWFSLKKYTSHDLSKWSELP